MRLSQSLRFLGTLLAASLVLLFAWACVARPTKNTGRTPVTKGSAMIENRKYDKPNDADLRKRLRPLEYEVTQHEGTEPAFRNEFWNNHEAGLYVDIASGEPLFSSLDKFDSGTGWPSFTKPVEGDRVTTRSDRAYGTVRTE
ncbi:MAG TPA: peptide-methionine (R)-S-oxide reductase, partial [Polyangiaceae bacterium]|nr:peptide-methionine (R)-S-oxide reductase [Polyangiaceae bacterium]